MKIFVACKFHQMRSLASFGSSGSGLASSFLVTPLCRRRQALHITLLYAAFSTAAASNCARRCSPPALNRGEYVCRIALLEWPRAEDHALRATVDALIQSHPSRDRAGRSPSPARGGDFGAQHRSGPGPLLLTLLSPNRGHHGRRQPRLRRARSRPAPERRSGRGSSSFSMLPAIRPRMPPQR